MRMANRFPLVLDTTDNNKIKEIQTGDNLNLTDNSIVGVQNITALGTIDAADITVNGNRLVAQAFNDLTDTPSTFVGSPNYFVKVKSDGTGLEYRPLADLGNIEIDTITVDTSIVPSVNNVGNVGTEALKFNEIVGTTLKGNLVSYAEEIVFNATTGKVSYAALQGAPTFLSEFIDDVGYLQTADVFTDITGSVFGDDSTLLVDGVNNLIPSSVLSGNLPALDGSALTNLTIPAQTFTSLTSKPTTLAGYGITNGYANTDVDAHINVSGASTNEVLSWTGTDYAWVSNAGGGGSVGNFTLASSVIDTDDSSGITITPAVTVSSDLTVENDLRVTNVVYAETFESTSTGAPTLTSESVINLSATDRVTINKSPLKFATFTTAERDALTSVVGDVLFNSTTTKLQVYTGAAWADLH